MFSGTMLIDTTYYKGLEYFDSLNFYNQNNYYFKSNTTILPVSNNNTYHNTFADVIESTWQYTLYIVLYI